MNPDDRESSDDANDFVDLPQPRMAERTDQTTRAKVLRRGFLLEYLTLGWNVVGIAVLAVAALTARSVALAGFGLDSLIEIGASVVVVW